MTNTSPRQQTINTIRFLGAGVAMVGIFIFFYSLL
jgi:hypothetical protein